MYEVAVVDVLKADAFGFEEETVVLSVGTPRGVGEVLIV